MDLFDDASRTNCLALLHNFFAHMSFTYPSLLPLPCALLCSCTTCELSYYCCREEVFDSRPQSTHSYMSLNKDCCNVSSRYVPEDPKTAWYRWCCCLDRPQVAARLIVRTLRYRCVVRVRPAYHQLAHGKSPLGHSTCRCTERTHTPYFPARPCLFDHIPDTLNPSPKV